MKFGEVAEWSKATVSKIVISFMGIEGSNPSLSAIFFTKKMANEDVSLLFTLLCKQKLFTLNQRFSSLPRRNAMKPGHLH